MKISIIIPVYNKLCYLNKLFDQLRAQTFQDYECLLIDDGSTDGSAVLCDHFTAEDNRFRVFHIPNGGVSRARNVGLENEVGEYITFIDADDELHPEYLLNLYNCIKKSGADLIISGYVKIWDRQKDRKAFFHPAGVGMFKLKELLPTFANVQRSSGIYGCCCAKLFPASLVKDIRFDEEIRLAEDFDFYLRLYPRISSLYLDDKSYYYYRQEAENSSVLVLDNQIDYIAQLKINLRYREFLKIEGEFTGENRTIVETLLNNYLYFSLFYCSIDGLSRRFDLLMNICQKEGLDPKGSGLMQKLLLGCLERGWKSGGKVLLTCYRMLRSVRNLIWER